VNTNKTQRAGPRHPRRDLYLLLVASMLNHSLLGGTRLGVALFAIHLDASPFVVGILMALYSLVPMLLAVHVGRFVDRTGVREPMVFASVALAVAAAMPFIWSGMPALYVTSLVIGASFMVYNISWQHLVGHIGPAVDRNQNFRLSALGFSVSGVVGPLIAGFGIDSMGYGATFLSFAIFPLVPIAILARSGITLPQPYRQAPQPEQKRSIASLLGHRQLRVILLAGALLDMAWDLFAFAIPVHGSRIGLSPSTIGLILGSFSAATFVIRALLPLTTRWLGAWPHIVVSFFATGASFALMALVENPAVLVVLAFVLGFSVGGSQPLAMSLIHDVAPGGRFGEAMGIRATINGVNQAGFPLLFGGLGVAIGMVPVFWTTAILMLVSGVATRRSRLGL
jgi:MFS family permease